MVFTLTRTPSHITKRNGLSVPFDSNKIAYALERCFASIQLDADINGLTEKVVNIISYRMSIIDDYKVTVEGVQDIVENVLVTEGEYEAAKHYILYRAERARKRASEVVIPEDVIARFNEDKNYFPTQLQHFQFLANYSRFNWATGHRETWVETVDRVVEYLHELASPYADLGSEFYYNIRSAILDMRVMPSMRLMAMAGDAARRDNVSVYNCSYLPVDSLESFCENMLISMAGCGVGYSVESQYVDRLPVVSYQHGNREAHHIIEDSAEGWAAAVRAGLWSWFDGEDITFDYSLIREAGTPLRTKGGRASGPEPLRRLLNSMRTRILARQGHNLTTLDAHDIMCLIGDAVVSGGVRRTAMISLFDAEDLNMLLCKSGDFARLNPQRWNANNSMVWSNVRSMTQRQFMDRFMMMLQSERGEPGIFNRDAAWEMAPLRRRSINEGVVWGTNPCGEINLRPRQFCNLTNIKAEKGLTRVETATRAVLATQIGVIQSLATYFPHLSDEWRRNCDDERLLGVGLAGQYDAGWELSEEVLRSLRSEVVAESARMARTLGINRATATTCVKPDGNSSVLLDVSSGIHPRWAPYYIRNIRISATSPLVHVLRDAGVPLSPENGQDPTNPNTWVISFPVKAPDGSATRNDVTALQQCEMWLKNKLNWTEHNPSVTITYTPDEVIDLTQWVWEHRNEIGGMAFLPRDDAQYDQLPYIEITREKYVQLKNEWDSYDIKWERVWLYEQTDMTIAAQMVACSAGICEI